MDAIGIDVHGKAALVFAVTHGVDPLQRLSSGVRLGIPCSSKNFTFFVHQALLLFCRAVAGCHDRVDPLRTGIVKHLLKIGINEFGDLLAVVQCFQLCMVPSGRLWVELTSMSRSIPSVLPSVGVGSVSGEEASASTAERSEVPLLEFSAVLPEPDAAGDGSKATLAAPLSSSCWAERAASTCCASPGRILPQPWNTNGQCGQNEQDNNDCPYRMTVLFLSARRGQ